MTQFDRAVEAAEFLRGRGFVGAEVAVVLGSGLGAFADTLSDPFDVAYRDIPHWPSPAIVGHAGRLVGGLSRGRRVIALSGRVHAYEGHELAAVTFGIRVLGRLGVPIVMLTNAAGGINTRFSQGALMLIEDHINFTGMNPLVGPNDERFGVRFPDMSAVYSPRLRAVAAEAAVRADLKVETGIYVGVLGPSFETPAEIRAFRTLGADAVGMSTVAEALVARHQGQEVLGISCITNLAAGVAPEPLDHDEVMATTRRIRGEFIALLEGTIERL